MLPETQASGEVRLYKFDSFPDKLHFHQTLLTGAYTDPSPIFVDGNLLAGRLSLDPAINMVL
jgi:hypothetical protein